MSSDYHSFVIADGKLVAAWDEMYEACADPWEQSRDATSPGRQAVVRYAHDIGANSLVEFGCGLGFFTDELVREGFDVVGVDCSEVAIARARELHPTLSLEVGQIEHDLSRHSGVDAVVLAGITWYVLDHLDAILDGLRRYHAGKHMIHLMTFYGPGRQQYGVDYFTTPDELIARFDLPVVSQMASGTRTPEDFESTILFRIPE